MINKKTLTNELLNKQVETLKYLIINDKLQDFENKIKLMPRKQKKQTRINLNYAMNILCNRMGV